MGLQPTIEVLSSDDDAVGWKLQAETCTRNKLFGSVAIVEASEEAIGTVKGSADFSARDHTARPNPRASHVSLRQYLLCQEGEPLRLAYETLGTTQRRGMSFKGRRLSNRRLSNRNLS